MAGDNEQPPLPPPKREMNSHFLPEQWKALAGLIGNAQVPDDRLNGKFDTKSWIIDTGEHSIDDQWNPTDINPPLRGF